MSYPFYSILNKKLSLIKNNYKYIIMHRFGNFMNLKKVVTKLNHNQYLYTIWQMISSFSLKMKAIFYFLYIKMDKNVSNQNL
jgi:hypothetical protein